MHYKPLGPSDEVPSDPVSVAVALADKIDTLTGFWAIDEKPTGSKDPFALRRAALGVIRLVLGNGVRFSLLHAFVRGQAELFVQLRSAGLLKLYENVSEAAFLSDDKKKEAILHSEGRIVPLAEDGSANLGRHEEHVNAVASDLLAFFHDRLKVYLKDQGIRHDIIDACLAMPGNDDLTLLVKRATALSATLKTDDGENLLQGFKRANNILAQAEQRTASNTPTAPIRNSPNATKNARSLPPSTPPKPSSPRRCRPRISPPPWPPWPPCARPSTPSSPPCRSMPTIRSPP